MNSTKLAGRYVLVETIASGGMGAVHKATDERLGRTVAVKLLRDELASDPRFVERFRREARAVAALSHPNIAGVYDYGEEDDRHFIVMEFIDGKDLSHLMRIESPFAQERAALIAASTLDALQHAHSAGVVHRDIKPANIMIGSKERIPGLGHSQERVKVTDFGIARAVGDATLTATGSVLGTAHYLSPEQASGGPIGPATDQYSTGIVLYEMLVGTVPFTGDSPVAIALRHMSDELPPPSTINSDISPELDAIVQRATSKEASGRYPDAQAMADALRASVSAAGNRPLAAGGTAVLGGAGSTAVLPDPHETNAAQRALTGEWDAQRVGRIVLMAFAALIALALLLLVFRLATNDEEPQRGERGGGAPPAEEASPTEEEQAPEETVVPDDILGRPFEEAESQLVDELGLKVKRNDEPSNDFPTPGVVSGADPPPGSTVTPGDTVTLTVSTGPEDDDDDEAEENDDQGRGPPPGKGPDKQKKPKDDD
ncbi:MAG: protein kinase domain-containing protein [Actinomycetota bacterium]